MQTTTHRDYYRRISRHYRAHASLEASGIHLSTRRFGSQYLTIISGKTAPIKDTLKRLGCTWDYRNRHWTFPTNRILDLPELCRAVGQLSPPEQKNLRIEQDHGETWITIRRGLFVGYYTLLIPSIGVIQRFNSAGSLIAEYEINR